MRILILGGTGFIGRELCARLARSGHEVIVPSRRPEKVAQALGKVAPGVVGAPFDGKTGEGWAHLLGPDSAIVNLAGENIGDGRWTEAKKQAILHSRLSAGAAVLDGLRRAGEAGRGLPQALIQASAVGIYGARGPEDISEDQPAGSGFLAEVARAWEDSTRGAEGLGVRRCVVRTSMVLGSGGALAKMLPIFRWGLGGPLGNGRQPLPWIHLEDEAGAIQFLLEHAACSGPYNLAAPEPADSRSFARALGRALGRPAFLPAPGLALRLILGQMAEEVLLSGARAVPARLVAAGYRFRHPHLAGALADILGGR